MNNGVTMDINRDINLSQQKEEEIILCLNQIINWYAIEKKKNQICMNLGLFRTLNINVWVLVSLCKNQYSKKVY